MVGLGLSFKISGLEPDRTIWQSAHLCQRFRSGGHFHGSHCWVFPLTRDDHYL